MRISINNTQHPIRKIAIRILEEVIAETGKNIKNEKWYRLEDFITDIIYKIKIKK